jgi:transcriptional regulator with XRE-family HTH domain
MKNIDLTRGDFPARLGRLREDRHLSKGDLAERTGLTYRTIHDIENGKRKRVQEKTLLLIAGALDLSLDELLNGDHGEGPAPAPARRSGRALWIRAAVLAGVGMLVAGGVLWWVGRDQATWTLEDGHLEVRHALLGIPLWGSHQDEAVHSCEDSPWDSDHLIITRARESHLGGVVQCVERATGEVLWTVGPDLDALTAAFGEEIVMSAGFSARTEGYPDVEGDGDPELLVRFTHGRYYPTAICLVDRDGTVRSHYASKGHVLTLAHEDIDGDGREEVVAGGTNNDPDYQGAQLFILDDVHAHGATVDSLCTPASPMPDSSLVRVILPQFPAPYMEQMTATRLAAWNVQIFRSPEGKARLSCEVGGPDPRQRMLVHFDEGLRPVGAEPSDKFREVARAEWPDSLLAAPGPTDRVWVTEWLARHHRFEAGHWR